MEPNTSPVCRVQTRYKYNAKAYNTPSAITPAPAISSSPSPPPPSSPSFRDRPGSVQLRTPVAKRSVLAGQETIVVAQACFLQAFCIQCRPAHRPVPPSPASNNPHARPFLEAFCGETSASHCLGCKDRPARVPTPWRCQDLVLQQQ